MAVNHCSSCLTAPRVKKGIAFQQWELEDPEEGGVCEEDIVLGEFFLAIGNNPCADDGAGKGFNGRELPRELGTHLGTRNGGFLFFRSLAILHCHPHDPLSILVEFVVMRFLPDIQSNQQAGGDAQGKSNDIDEGVGFVPAQASERDEQVVFKHAGWLCLKYRRSGL